MDEFLLTLKAHWSTLPHSDGPGVVAVGVLVLVLLVSLRGPERRKALGPLLLLGLHLLLLGMTELFPENLQVREVLAPSALLCLLLSLGRALFLLFTWAWSRLRSRPLPQIFLDVVQTLVYALALLITLRGAGVDAASLLTGSALVTVAVGLSLRDTLGNLFAGLAIQAQHPFDVGDLIQFDQHAQHIGRVVEINWRVTKVLTLDEVEIV